MLGFEQIVAVSRDDARDELLEILDDVGFAATSWQEGSIGLGLVEIGAWVWSQATTYAESIKKLGFNETSVDEALDRYSKSRYQNTRQEAVAEVHRVTLSCETGEGPHAIQAGAFKAKNANGYIFENVVDSFSTAGPTYPANYPVNLPSGGSIEIMMQAQKPGEEAITEDGGISTIITTLSGVTITSTTRVRTGVKRETNERLQLRNSLRWAELVAVGPIDDQLIAHALKVEAVDRVRVNSTNPRGAGTVDVYVTGATGAITAEELAEVQALLSQRVMHDPDGDACLAKHAGTEDLDIIGTVYTLSGYSWADDILPAIEAALEAFRRTIPLGGFSYPDPGNIVPVNEIEHVIRSVEIGGVKVVAGVKITTPASDLAVSSYAHVTAGSWNFTPVALTD